MTTSNRRRARVAVGSAFFFHGLCFSSWASRIPAIQQRLELSEAQLGSVLFAVPAGLLISMPVTAKLVSKFGSKKILTLGIVLYALLLSTLGLSTSTPQLATTLFFYGMASNFVNVAVNTQAIEVETLYGRSIMASFHGLWSLAGFTGASLGTMMIAIEAPPLIHFLIMSTLVVIGISISQIGFVEASTRVEKEIESTTSRFRLPERALLMLGLIAFLSMICEGTMFDWAGVYFKKAVQADQGWIASGYTAFMCTMAGTRFIADGFLSRFGLNRTLQVSGLLTGTGLLLAVAFPYLPTAILGFLLVGSGVSAVVPLVMSAAGRAASGSASAAIATVSTIGFIGFLIGPPLIGWIAGASNLRVSFGLVAILGFGIALLGRSSSNERP